MKKPFTETDPKANEIVEFYRSATTADLVKRADAVCRAHVGDSVYIRGLIEVSNECRLNCLYCGIRHGNPNVERYRLSNETVLEIIRQGMEAGFQTFVLQGGEGRPEDFQPLLSLVDRISETTGGKAALTLSFGAMPKERYAELKKAGASRYLMRFETSDPELHRTIRNGLTLEQRLKSLYDLKDLGFETGSGYMVGLPGETEETRINNALLCHKLEIDMAGIGPFLPHPDTPLAKSAKENIELTVRSTALLRLLCPDINLPATTAAGSLDPAGREKMLAAGANVLMPNLSPIDVKKNYLLYPDKICLDESGFDCLSCLKLRVASIGKTMSMGRGDSKRFTEAAL